MGLDATALTWIKLVSLKFGVNFDKTLTLGRQYCSVQELKLASHWLKKSGYKDSDIILQPDGYTEKYFEWMGSKALDVLDYSDYEGAGIIHDLNVQLPQELINKYDCVIDGGTLEHVFEYSQGLKNAMSAVKIGGVLINISPTNNWCGHGFFQLSPCIFMDTLNVGNGFEILEMGLYEKHTLFGADRVRILDKHGPLFIRGRGLLFVISRKIADVPNKISIQQEDYSNIWKAEKTKKKWAETIKNSINKSRLTSWILFRIKHFANKCDSYRISKKLKEFQRNGLEKYEKASDC